MSLQLAELCWLYVSVNSSINNFKYKIKASQKLVAALSSNQVEQYTSKCFANYCNPLW
jgi:hypothetical protein